MYGFYIQIITKLKYIYHLKISLKNVKFMSENKII